MLVGERRIRLDEASRHHEVKCDPISIFLAQSLEFVAGDPVKLVGRYAFGNQRIVVPGTHRTRAERVAILGGFALAGIPIAAGRSAALGPQALLARRVRTPSRVGFAPSRG